MPENAEKNETPDPADQEPAADQPCCTEQSSASSCGCSGDTSDADPGGGSACCDPNATSPCACGRIGFFVVIILAAVVLVKGLTQNQTKQPSPGSGTGARVTEMTAPSSGSVNVTNLRTRALAAASLDVDQEPEADVIFAVLVDPESPQAAAVREEVESVAANLRDQDKNPMIAWIPTTSPDGEQLAADLGATSLPSTVLLGRQGMCVVNGDNLSATGLAEAVVTLDKCGSAGSGGCCGAGQAGSGTDAADAPATTE